MHMTVFGDKKLGFTPQLNATRLYVAFWILNGVENNRKKCGDPWFFYQRFFGIDNDYTPCLVKKDKLYLTEFKSADLKGKTYF